MAVLMGVKWVDPTAPLVDRILAQTAVAPWAWDRSHVSILEDTNS